MSRTADTGGAQNDAPRRRLRQLWRTLNRRSPQATGSPCRLRREPLLRTALPLRLSVPPSGAHLKPRTTYRTRLRRGDRWPIPVHTAVPRPFPCATTAPGLRGRASPPSSNGESSLVRPQLRHLNFRPSTVDFLAEESLLV
jgi:hypothetical protein